MRVVVHEAEEGGYWAEVPAIPGCATQGETWEELLSLDLPRNSWDAGTRQGGRMPVQYVTDENGSRTAVVVPLAEWEAIQRRLALPAEEELTPEEAAKLDAAWAEYRKNPASAKPIEQVIREQLKERVD